MYLSTCLDRLVTIGGVVGRDSNRRPAVSKSKCSNLSPLAWFYFKKNVFNPLNAELNPICHLLSLLGAHPILHISRIRVKPERLKCGDPRDREC
jgi:hypothetical protein